MKKNNLLNKWSKDFITWSFIILAIYFWMVSLILLLVCIIIGSIVFYILYKLVLHISNQKSFNIAREHKPKWFIFGDRLYNKIIDYLENSSKAKGKSFYKDEITKAMEFYNFTSLEEVSKHEIKFKWKETQKIYHPDSGLKPDTKKSQLANNYKDVLLDVIKNRND